MARKYQDILGQTFERLTAIEYIGEGKWLCQCSCGKQSVSSVTKLQSGKVKSCGCYSRNRATKHGMCNNRLYRTWTAMRDRCRNPNNGSYHNYGGRGIRVCDRWDSFSNFVADMGVRPKGFDIDRIDNDGDYSPENCRWVKRSDNLRNTRITRKLTHQGKTQPLRVWAEEYGLSYSTLKNRIDRGWDAETALTSGRYVYGRRNRVADDQGEKISVTELARRKGIKPQIVCDRLRRGWSLDDAINSPIRQQRNLRQDEEQ